MRIFLPTLLAFSSTRTRRPRWAAVAAHIRPEAPAPRMITSKVGLEDCTGMGSAQHGKGQYTTAAQRGRADAHDTTQPWIPAAGRTLQQGLLAPGRQRAGAADR